MWHGRCSCRPIYVAVRVFLVPVHVSWSGIALRVLSLFVRNNCRMCHLWTRGPNRLSRTYSATLSLKGFKKVPAQPLTEPYLSRMTVPVVPEIPLRVGSTGWRVLKAAGDQEYIVIRQFAANSGTSSPLKSRHSWGCSAQKVALIGEWQRTLRFRVLRPIAILIPNEKQSLT
jgi:hypothetical protein